VIKGRHAPWTFDLGYKNGTLHLINSLALNAGPGANLGRALVYKGMLQEVEAKRGDSVQGIAVVLSPKPEQRDESASTEAIAILKDAGIETYDVADVDELTSRVEKDLTPVSVG
jgi:hypothetical protein